MPKLTKRFVETLVPDLQNTLIVWDSELKGFGIVVLPSGRRTYCLQYRNAQRVKKRLKIGVHGPVSTEQARAFAKEKLLAIVQGHDPSEEKKESQSLPTFLELVEDYLERHGPRKRARSVSDDQKMFKHILIPAFEHKKVAHITRRDVETLHLRLKHTPYHANRVIALLSKMFSLAISWGWCESNPVKGLPRYPEEKRERWLNEEELGRLWAVLDGYPTYLTAYVFKLLLLTGARKGELLAATWDQFDLEKGIWTKPSHLTKQKKREHLPLSEKALKVLRDLQNLESTSSTYLFPGRGTGGSLREVKKFWQTVLKKAEIQNVRIHDLRHTHASHLVSSGLSLSIVGKLLGHTQASTTQRYAHLADAPLRQAAELFGAKVDALCP